MEQRLAGIEQRFGIYPRAVEGEDCEDRLDPEEMGYGVR